MSLGINVGLGSLLLQWRDSLCRDQHHYPQTHLHFVFCLPVECLVCARKVCNNILGPGHMLTGNRTNSGSQKLDVQGICLLQVPEDIFICASTGRCYPISQSPYLGVESMWNHNNYWVCMQMPEPHSDSRAIPKQLSLDFTDASKWEYVLPNAAPQVHLLLGSCDSCCCCCCCCCSNGMTVRTAVLVQKLE